MTRTALILLGLLSYPVWVISGHQSGPPLTNDSIIKLVKAGIADDTISIVNTQPCKYSLSAADVIGLKEAGVPQRVIAAMFNKWASGQAGRPGPGVPSRIAGQAGAEGPPGPPSASEAPAPTGPDTQQLSRRPPAGLSSAGEGQPFDDAAYHNCLVRHVVFGGPPCPPLQETDRVYHACVQDHMAPLIDLEEVKHKCAILATDPNTPKTIPTAKVRKVYVGAFVGQEFIKRQISKHTCLEVVDSPDRADAVLKVRAETQEYNEGDIDRSVECSSDQSSIECTDGITTTYAYCADFRRIGGTYHNAISWFFLMDPRTRRRGVSLSHLATELLRRDLNAAR